MKVEKVGTAIGAEISGLDLARPPGADEMAAIRSALAEHLVVFFRDQRLIPAELRAFASELGPLLAVPYVDPLPEHPEIIEVRKEPDERRISVFGGEWHSDFTFLESPPTFTVLHALEVPACGGDTLWASTIAAFDALSPGMHRLLVGLRAMHSGHVYGAARPPTHLRTSTSIRIHRGNPEADRERSHPAVALHVPSGRDALYVNPIYTTRLEGMSAPESAPLLAHLYARATRPELTCRFRWQPGSVAVWDNRATLHLAVNDYDGHRRVLHRATVGGDPPLPAAGASGASP